MLSFIGSCTGLAHSSVVDRRSGRYCHDGSSPYANADGNFRRSAWCPEPKPELMRGFPKSMLETAAKPGFWEKAKDLLHVTPANKIDDKVFGELQNDIDAKLHAGIPNIPTASFFFLLPRYLPRDNR